MIPEDAAARHDRIGEIFGEALDLPPQERRAFLEKVCEGDGAMVAEIEALLDAASQSFNFFGQTTSRVDRRESFPITGCCVKQCRKCGLCVEAPALMSAPKECPSDGAPLDPAFPGNALIDGKYRVKRCLGRGGMGAVYLARHVGVGRDFALKLITYNRNDPASLEMFSAEAKALGQLKHPHIVDVSDYGIDSRGLPYLVMELIDGVALDHSALPPAEAIDVLVKIADALEAVHDQGMLHRDLKPGNVLLTGNGPKLIDFGLVAARERGAGTPAYMAPELKQGGVATIASDLYAYGMMARKLLTGAPPEVERALEPLLESDSARRPATARRAAQALSSAWLEARRREWRTREIPRRVKWAAALGAFCALLAFAVRNVPVVAAVEARAIDSRLGMAKLTAPDLRILILSIDEASTAADPAPLASRGAEFGRTLERVLDAGAAHLGADLLLPESWSRVPEFSRFVLRGADRLTLSLFSAPGATTVGAECVNGLTAAALGPAKTDALFAFVNFDLDADGAVRRGRARYRDREGKSRPSWAASVARVPAPEEFWLARIDRSRIERISWKDVAGVLERNPDRFRGRLVLLGAEYLGAGDLHSLAGETSVSGLEVQAVTLATILASFPVQHSNAPSVAVSLLFPALALLGRWWMPPAACVLFLSTAWLLCSLGGLLVPVAAPVLAGVCAAGLGSLAKRRWPAYPLGPDSPHVG